MFEGLYGIHLGIPIMDLICGTADDCALLLLFLRLLLMLLTPRSSSLAFASLVCLARLPRSFASLARFAR